MYYLVFHLDKDGYKGIVLKQLSSLIEMDKYIQTNFDNNLEVRKKYEQDIGEFCLDERKKIERENKRNNRNRLGAISLFFINNNVHYKIPIIYKNDHRLLSKNNCLKKIKESLDNDEILYELFETKRYLLSKNEIDLLFKYKKFPYDKSFKDDAIAFFIDRIKRENEEKQYYYFRCLMNLCRLNRLDIKTSKLTIKDVNLNFPGPKKLTKEVLARKIVSYSEDEYFNRLIDEEDYDQLFNLYDRDIIERDTNIFKKD